MVTLERIVEAYVRHVKKWTTVCNIKCPRGRAQNEIDILAAEPGTQGRMYHIEVYGSVSSTWQ